MTKKPNLWTVRNVEVLSECDVCGDFALIAQEIDLTKKAGLAEARRLGWRMVQGRWTCPECPDPQNP